MDTMVQLYMEETEDMLQKAEECIIRLEQEYSAGDVNELFRIAHTIKGSSHMVGYEEIGEIVHKMEDMLDCVRNGSVQFDQRIVSLCFEGLDIVKKMLQFKKEQGPWEIMEDLLNAAARNNEIIEALIRAKKKEEEKTVAEQLDFEIVSSLLTKERRGKNKYYISFFIEEDAPMVSPVFLLILKAVEDIGTLAYSSITDKYFSECFADQETRTLDIILCTDIEEAELYTYFSLAYVEKMNIVDLTRSKLEANDYYFINSDDTFYFVVLKAFMRLYQMLFGESKTFKVNKQDLRSIESLRRETVNAFGKIKNNAKISAFINDFNEFFNLISEYEGGADIDEVLCSNIRAQMVKLLERANNYAKGKYIFRVFKPEKNGFIDRLRSFTGMVDKSSTLLIFLDLSKLDILHENEVKDLIEIKKQMEAQDVEIALIAEGPKARRIINIFDSIKPVEEFNLYGTEVEAILGMFRSQASCQRLFNKINEVQYA